jgi:hypothetical protein
MKPNFFFLLDDYPSASNRRRKSSVMVMALVDGVDDTPRKLSLNKPETIFDAVEKFAIISSKFSLCGVFNSYLLQLMFSFS